MLNRPEPPMNGHRSSLFKKGASAASTRVAVMNAALQAFSNPVPHNQEGVTLGTTMPTPNTGTSRKPNTSQSTSQQQQQQLQQQLQQQAQQRDLFRMRYLRFRCRDVDRTIDFYTTFGMAVEYDCMQEKTDAPTVAVAGNLAGVGANGARGAAANSHLKPSSLAANGGGVRNSGISYRDGENLKSDLNARQAAIAMPALEELDGDDAAGVPATRVVALSYHATGSGSGSNASDANADRMQLVFEEDAALRDEAGAGSPGRLGIARQLSGGSASAAAAAAVAAISDTSAASYNPDAVKAAAVAAVAAAAATTAASITTPQTQQETSYIKRIDIKTPHNYEYLVFYVHFIQRLVKRFASKGFEIITQPIELDTSKFAVLRDPNGIEVRLFDLTESQMNETNKTKKQWFTRLGYYAIPTSNADESTLMYESLFQIRQPKAMPVVNGISNLIAGGSSAGGISGSSGTNSGKEHIDPVTGRSIDPNDMNAQTRNVRKTGAATIVRQAIAKAQGFRIVDMEDFVVGLSNTVFYWLGNDLRTTTCTICFTEVGNADTGTASTVFNKDTSPLIGIGFEVPNLDAVINKLKYDTKDQLDWINYRYKVPSVGMIAKFKDRINGLCLELLCTRTLELAMAKQAAAAAAAAAGGVSATTGANALGNKPGQRARGGPQAAIDAAAEAAASTAAAAAVAAEAARRAAVPTYAIDHNHLRGHARILSAGAVYRIRGDYESVFGATSNQLDQDSEQQDQFNVQANGQPSTATSQQQQRGGGGRRKSSVSQSTLASDPSQDNLSHHKGSVALSVLSLANVNGDDTTTAAHATGGGNGEDALSSSINQPSGKLYQISTNTSNQNKQKPVEKKRPTTPRPKTKDDLQREAFVSRTKSRSAVF